MKLALYPLMIASACGLMLSATAHLLSLAGLPIPGGQLVWGLHVGVFVVWLPAVLLSVGLQRSANRKDFWKIILAGCPPWMRYGMYGLFGYAIFNFVFFISTVSNDNHRIASGQKQLSSEVRGFSGHWMVFYAAAFVMFYSRIHAPELFQNRKCPRGHLVLGNARFCSECGSAIPEEPSARLIS